VVVADLRFQPGENTYDGFWLFVEVKTPINRFASASMQSSMSKPLAATKATFCESIMSNKQASMLPKAYVRLACWNIVVVSRPPTLVVARNAGVRVSLIVNTILSRCREINWSISGQFLRSIRLEAAYNWMFYRVGLTVLRFVCPSNDANRLQKLPE
jgi:hypothetical protein